MKIIYIRIDDPCCPNIGDVSVSEFQKGSMSMKDAVQAGRRIAHLYMVPDDFDLSTINIESWDKAPAHALAEAPDGIDGLVTVDVCLGDKLVDLVKLSEYAPEPKKTAKKVKKAKAKKRRR